MKYERYEINAEPCLTIYEFVSDGPKGKIVKLVEYNKTGVDGVYNLGFGDKDLITGKMNDNVVTDNGDSTKVLATVASTVFTFFNKYPNAWIYATGSSRSRTRLYRMGISNNLTEISQVFDVYGLIGDAWYEFEKNTEYDAFMIKRKISKFDYEI